MVNINIGGIFGFFSSQNSSVVATTVYKLDGWGSIPGKCKIFLLHSLQIGSGAHLACYLMSTGDSTEVTLQEHEGDHSSPSSAEVTNKGAVPPLPHISSWYSA
jgi:hypothetical protein